MLFYKLTNSQKALNFWNKGPKSKCLINNSLSMIYIDTETNLGAKMCMYKVLNFGKFTLRREKQLCLNLSTLHK